jgi:hypothetical protein
LSLTSLVLYHIEVREPLDKVELVVAPHYVLNLVLDLAKDVVKELVLKAAQGCVGAGSKALGVNGPVDPE